MRPRSGLLLSRGTSFIIFLLFAELRIGRGPFPANGQQKSESLEECATAAGFDIPASDAESSSDFSASTFGRHHKNKNGTSTVRPSGTGATGIARPSGTGGVGRGGNSTIVPPVVSLARPETQGVVFSLAVAVVMAVFLL